MKRVTLELGGKSPTILLDDANLEEAIPAALGMAFLNSGQACAAGTRLLVPSKRLDAVKRAIADAMHAFPVGDPADSKTVVGPMVSQKQFDRVQSYIRKGIEEGAEVLVGGEGHPQRTRSGLLRKAYSIRERLDVLASIASITEHLRHSYRPLSCVLVKSPEGHWQPVPAEPGARTEEGLVAYRFGTSLYYANASRLLEDVVALVGQGGPLRWLVIDCAAIVDVDYSAAAVLIEVVEHAHQRNVRVVFTSVLGPVRQQLDRYGISKALGQDAYFDTPGQALEAFQSTER